MRVYRYWGGKTELMGSPYFGTEFYSAEDARRLLALPGGNTAANVTAFRIPKGTTVLVGDAACQTGKAGFGDWAVGGGAQIYVPDVSVPIPLP